MNKDLKTLRSMEISGEGKDRGKANAKAQGESLPDTLKDHLGGHWWTRGMGRCRAL